MTDLISSETLLQRIKDPQQCVLPVMLDRQAARVGDKTLFVFDGGPSWSYAETRRIARGTAASFEALGIRRGDRVLVLLEDGPDIVRISLALCYIGAVMAPLNPELKGEVLKNLIDYAEANLLVTAPELLDQLPPATYGSLQRVVVLGDTAPHKSRNDLELLPAECLSVSPDDPAPVHPPLAPWEVHSLFFTSGTTGVSKGMESTHAHCATMAIDGLRYLTEQDRFCTPCGYFHVGGANAPWAVVNAGASMLVVGKFSASRFWDQINSHNATVALLIGVMCDFLMNQPPRDDDAENCLRQAVIQPLPDDFGAFSRRFGVQIYTQYDQTETPPAIISEPLDPSDTLASGFCGRVRPGFEARIVDENDCEVPTGTPGELALRCDAPWILATSYFNKPDQTARAWRNGWFHTGDVFRTDAEGNFYFVDRSKDVIRRRGENISSFDVERALAGHPAVEAAAAFAVESEYSESEIMAVVQISEGAEFDPGELMIHMECAVPGFMVPRYLRFMKELPRSATDKVKKDDLQRQGVTVDTWDRLANASLDRVHAPAGANAEKKAD